MKKIFLYLSLGLALSLGAIPTSLRAQESKSSEQEGPRHKRSPIAEQLALSEDQQKQWKSTRSQHRQQLRDLKESTALSQEEKIQELQKLKSQHDEAIRSILTEDQYQKLQELASTRKKQRGARHNNPLDLEQRKALREEIRNYQRENIVPKIMEQRQKLDASLDASAKQQLEEVRQALEELKTDKQSLRKSLKEEGRAGSSEEKKTQRQQFQERFKAQMEIVRPIAEQYTGEIESLREELSGDFATWKEDIQTILLKYFDSTEEIPRRSLKQMQRAGHINKMRFLLLNPDKVGREQESLLMGSQVYPNPSTGQSRLAYELKEDTFVLIQLLDGQGNLVRPLEKGPKKAGSHTLEIDTGLLQPGSYMIRLEYDGRQESKRIQIR